MNIEKETTKAIVSVDLDLFDATVECAGGFEFELKHMDGISGTGIRIIVQGTHSDEVSTWSNALVNRAMLEQAVAARSKNPPPPKTMEEMRDQNIEGTALRAIGWKNVKQPFTRELLKAALRRNPHWIPQIIAESDNLGNFTKKQ